jgi:hypothetical protein
MERSVRVISGRTGSCNTVAADSRDALRPYDPVRVGCAPQRDIGPPEASCVGPGRTIPAPSRYRRTPCDEDGNHDRSRCRALCMCQ